MITAVDGTIARPDASIVDAHFLLYHLNSPPHLALCERHATGATRPRVSRKNMGALPLLLPPMPLQKLFGEFARNANEQRATLDQQTKALARARDILLPRLMSGKIAV